MLRIRQCLLVLPFALATVGAQGLTVLPQNLEQLESAADLVFVGVCTTRTAEVDVRGIPRNVFRFTITEAVKGRLMKGGSVVFRQLGTNIPNAKGLASRFPGLPDYKIGQEVLIFLNPPSRIGLTSPVGLSQGVFPVVRDKLGKGEIVLDPLRRKILAREINMTKYQANERFTVPDRRLLSEPPERVDLTAFCSLIRKMTQEREKAEKQARAEAARAAAPENR